MEECVPILFLHDDARLTSGSPRAEVVVCIVADGRKAIHPRILDWFVNIPILLLSPTDR